MIKVIKSCDIGGSDLDDLWLPWTEELLSCSLVRFSEYTLRFFSRHPRFHILQSRLDKCRCSNVLSCRRCASDSSFSSSFCGNLYRIWLFSNSTAYLWKSPELEDKECYQGQYNDWKQDWEEDLHSWPSFGWILLFADIKIFVGCLVVVHILWF